ncbi:MAG TPA: hypothetical protein VFH68_24690 [Polyangia bacterium]|jgi:hypothetical protein|nr:hypothetical protein [Polyangia bacterium]
MLSATPLFALITLAAADAPVAKLPAELAQEMADAVVAVDKALGLESWDARGNKPCIDRGGLGATAKDVGVEETRRCAATSLDKGLPSLGKSYVLAILMADIGPVTVVALGTGDAAGWGAYSCDPGRKCPPIKLELGKKWGKRLIDRRAKACAQTNTIWFPPEKRACAVEAATGGVPATPGAGTPTPAPTGKAAAAAPAPKTAPTPAK